MPVGRAGGAFRDEFSYLTVVDAAGADVKRDVKAEGGREDGTNRTYGVAVALCGGFSNFMKHKFAGTLLVLVAFLSGAFGGMLRGESLLQNGNFEKGDASGTWVADWGKADGATWESEDGGHFLRLVQATPGKMINLYMAVPVAEGTRALKLSYRVRYTGVEVGEKPWFDARFIINFMDAQFNGHSVDPSPEPPHFLGTSKGWRAGSMVFMVPKGAKALAVMPALFYVKGGTFDIDDLVLEAATEGEIAKHEAEVKDRVPLPVPATEAPMRGKWPAELFVAGNRLRTKEGREVWLQGVAIPGMDYSASGENTLAAEKVAIEKWKGNIVRLEIRDDFWNGKGDGQSDGGAAYRAQVDTAVNLAANRGVYVMIDLHRFRAVQAEHLEFWKAVASVYKNHPAVLFDIFNEPHDISWEVWRNGGPVTEKAGTSDEDAFLSEADKKKRAKTFQSPGMQAVVNVIRETGARNIIVAGGNGWAFDLSGITKGYALDEKGGNGIMYAWHVYNWHTGWEESMMATAAKYPIMVGECGADVNKMDFIPAEQQEDPATWSPRFIAFVQKNKLNWTAFSFHPHCTPVLISDWKFTPTPGWGALVKEALAGRKFEYRGVK